MANRAWSRGVPLKEDLQTQLQKLIRERGERNVAEALGVSITSVMRAAAGCGLRRGTIFMIESKLSCSSQQAA